MEMVAKVRVCIIMPPTPGLFNQRTNIPLGPLYIAAILEQGEHEVELVSLLDHDIPIKWPKADLYAMGFASVQASSAKAIVNLVRSHYPDAKFLAAGCHPETCPIETLNNGFDSILFGEGEITIFQILKDLPNLERFYYGTPVMELNTIPFPARHLLPKGDLFNNAATATMRFDHGTNHLAAIITSRGCPGRCAFCSNNYPCRTRFRSAENVVGEMEQLVNMGINCFKMQDDTLTLSGRHVTRLGNLIEKTFGSGRVFSRVSTRVDTFSEKIVPAIKKMGVEVLSFGVESGSQKILDIVNKKATVEDSERALRLSKDHGFTTWAFMIFGLPGECEETVDETIAFLERNRDYIDTAGWNTFVPYPGCDIGKYPEKYKVRILHRDWDKYYCTAKRDIIALPHGVSYSKMIELKNKMLNAFIELGYSRPEWEGDLG